MGRSRMSPRRAEVAFMVCSSCGGVEVLRRAPGSAGVREWVVERLGGVGPGDGELEAHAGAGVVDAQQNVRVARAPEQDDGDAVGRPGVEFTMRLEVVDERVAVARLETQRRLAGGGRAHAE